MRDPSNKVRLTVLGIPIKKRLGVFGTRF